jgi:hypothetical protein
MSYGRQSPATATISDITRLLRVSRAVSAPDEILVLVIQGFGKKELASLYCIWSFRSFGVEDHVVGRGGGGGVTCCHDVIQGFVLYLVRIIVLARERLWIVIRGRRRVG